ncbi:Hypothetical predicted protein [Olea europaea subsp. europaea]|uniref:Uncharacterized protein n=1 Tax=Olea europaea subsp. europaea TaxID=158383 RepID=A0A8S0PTP7_OLEEU|nr:Hypothetical predicted protein [Olea europaea subsp. europaea]
MSKEIPMPQSLTGSQCKGSKWFSNSCRDEHIAGPLFLKFKLMTGNASVVFFGAQLMLIVLYPRTNLFPPLGGRDGNPLAMSGLAEQLLLFRPSFEIDKITTTEG